MLHQAKKNVTRNMVMAVCMLAIILLLGYATAFHFVIVPSQYDIINRNAFQWKNTQADATLKRSFRWFPYEFREGTDKGDLYKVENRLLGDWQDTKVMLKDIRILNEQVHLNIELEQAMGMIEGRLLTVSKYENDQRFLQKPTVQVRDEQGEIPVIVTVTAGRVQLIMAKDQFFRHKNYLSIEMSGFYELEYQRNWFL